jgi:predicted DCC family thiol-disulfide oxidoreductase YuxK
MTENRIERGRAYMLWDGDCGFCRRTIHIAQRLDESRSFTFASHQSFAESELKNVGLDHRRCARELQVVTRSGKIFGGAFALNYFLWQQPRLRVLVAPVFLFPVLFLMEVLLYKFVASNRLLVSKFLFPKSS